MKKILLSFVFCFLATFAFASNSSEQQEQQALVQTEISQVQLVDNQISSFLQSENNVEDLERQTIVFILSCGIVGTISWDDTQINPTPAQLVWLVLALDDIFCG